MDHDPVIPTMAVYQQRVLESQSFSPQGWMSQPVFSILQNAKKVDRNARE